MRATYLGRAATLWISVVLLLGTGVSDAGSRGASRCSVSPCPPSHSSTALPSPALHQAPGIAGQHSLGAVMLADGSARMCRRGAATITVPAPTHRLAFSSTVAGTRIPPTPVPPRLSAPRSVLEGSMRVPSVPVFASRLVRAPRLKATPSGWRLTVPTGAGAHRPPDAVAPVSQTTPALKDAAGARVSNPVVRIAAPREQMVAQGARDAITLLAGARAVSDATPLAPEPAHPGAEPSDGVVRLRMVEGKSRILPTQGVRTIQIDDPSGAVAEVQPVSDTEILLLAKGPGVTMVRVWDRRGRTEYELTVEPGPARRQQMIQEAINDSKITVRVVENTCILEGEVGSVEQMMRAQRIAEAFSVQVVNLLQLPAPPPAQPPAPGGPSLLEQLQAVLPAGEVTAELLPGQPTTVVLRGQAPRVEDIDGLVAIAEKVVAPVNGTVINLVQLAQPRQVRVQARMLNVDSRRLRELGVRWMDTSTTGPTLFGQTTPTGGFQLLTSIQANIKTLLEDAHAELLSAPSTVVNSGGTGYIHIGGEVPIPQLSGATGGTDSVLTTTVTYRNFGVLLGIEPVAEPGDEITLRLLVEVSSIDRNNAVTVNGSEIPGFSTKRALNELRLKAGETLVVGGLISHEEASTVHRFPILADIPIFGSFFRSIRKEKFARELVLFLTPELLPGPEPPAGLRQTPVLKPGGGSTNPFNLSTSTSMQGSGVGTSSGGTR
jgi:pilus assembly protein CpaC